METVLSCGNAAKILGEVEHAEGIDWGVPIDAYLMDAARVGNRYVASVYCDLSGISANGEIVVTPPVRQISKVGRFEMLQSLCGNDHYVVVTRFTSEEK